MLNWFDRHQVGHVIGVAKNPRLHEQSLALRPLAQERFRATEQKQRLFGEVHYGARSWNQARRVLVKAEPSHYQPNSTRRRPIPRLSHHSRNVRAKSNEIEGFVDQTFETWKQIDILVNNASNVARIGAADGSVVETTMDTWDEVYACNLRGPAVAGKFAIPHMVESGGGAIVNIASIQGLAGDVVRSVYGATKARLVMLSKYIATSHGRQGIHCNSVAPGKVMSPSAYDEGVEDFPKPVENHMTGTFRGQPADLAEVICFTCSDEARYLTAQNITVDGGLTCHLPMYDDVVRLDS